jgi:hypothetical protein
MTKSRLIEYKLLEPKLIEYDTLKKLLNESYNEGSTPFTQIIGKYTTYIVKDNWFYLIVIIFILIVVYFNMTKADEIVPKEIVYPIKSEKKDNKLRNISEYYTNSPRIFR